MIGAALTPAMPARPTPATCSKIFTPKNFPGSRYNTEKFSRVPIEFTVLVEKMGLPFLKIYCKKSIVKCCDKERKFLVNLRNHSRNILIVDRYYT